METRSKTAVAVWTVAAGLALAAPANAAPRIISPPLHFAVPSSVCIDHRGNVDRPEHTEETQGAYEDAIAGGWATELEADIRWTRTGFPVLLHDSDLGKFGAPELNVDDLSVGQAQSHESATGDVVLTLYQLRLLALRWPSRQWELELKVEPADWDVLDSRLGDLKDRVTLSSFDLPRLRRAQDRGYRTVLLSAGDVLTTAAPVVAQDFSTIDAATVETRAKSGVLTYAYTPDTEVAWKAALDKGVSKLITNKPKACNAFLAQPLRKK